RPRLTLFPYTTLFRSLVAEVVDLSQVAALVGWDQETMMPPKGALFRATQQATLHGVIHERLTDRKIGDLLDKLEEPVVHAGLSEDRKSTRLNSSHLGI